MCVTKRPGASGRASLVVVVLAGVVEAGVVGAGVGGVAVAVAVAVAAAAAAAGAVAVAVAVEVEVAVAVARLQKPTPSRGPWRVPWPSKDGASFAVSFAQLYQIFRARPTMISQK